MHKKTHPIIPTNFGRNITIQAEPITNRHKKKKKEGGYDALGFSGLPLAHLEMAKWTFSRLAASDL